MENSGKFRAPFLHGPARLLQARFHDPPVPPLEVDLAANEALAPIRNRQAKDARTRAVLRARDVSGCHTMESWRPGTVTRNVPGRTAGQRNEERQRIAPARRSASSGGRTDDLLRAWK